MNVVIGMKRVKARRNKCRILIANVLWLWMVWFYIPDAEEREP